MKGLFFLLALLSFFAALNAQSAMTRTLYQRCSSYCAASPAVYADCQSQCAAAAHR